MVIGKSHRMKLKITYLGPLFDVYLDDLTTKFLGVERSRETSIFIIQVQI
jgi:hypothetical protein